MQAIQDFDAVINAPAEIKITRVASNKKIKWLLKDTLQFVKKVLDKAVATIADTEDHFVGVYRNMRQINGSPTHRRSLFTTCVDIASGAIITGAKLQIATSKKNPNKWCQRAKLFSEFASRGACDRSELQRIYYPRCKGDCGSKCDDEGGGADGEGVMLIFIFWL
jgi:hypothetical protein